MGNRVASPTSDRAGRSSARWRLVIGAGTLAIALGAVVLLPGNGSRLGLKLASGAGADAVAGPATKSSRPTVSPATARASVVSSPETPSAAASEVTGTTGTAGTAGKKADAKIAGKAAAPKTGCKRSTSTTAKVKVTKVQLGIPVTGYGDESDTAKLPMAMAATPSGTSWLAWQGTNSRVYLAKLDCGDHLVGKPTSFAGIDLQDVQADRTGGVLLLTRRGSCHTGPLCGGASSPCNTMHMVRFDNSGHLVWQRQVTNLTSSRGGYDDGARFAWWYQHHGRLAYDGTNYAAYFGVAITVQNGSCVDIHEGDRMQVVNPQGKLVSGHNSFAVGCSHAWTSRIVWDPHRKRFAMVCATDNECRIAQPNPYRTVVSGTCDGTLFGGDLVLAKSAGYWTAWSQGGTTRLSHFTTAAASKTIQTGVKAAHPHLVSYGPGRMLLAWQSGATMRAQAYDSGTGKRVGGQLTIAVKDHDYQAFKAYADGSAAYPAAGGTSTSIKIARMLPLGT